MAALRLESVKGEWKLEEEYVLRIRDESLAERIRKVLKEEGQSTNKLQIIFEESNVNGKLRFEGEEYQLTVLNLPSVAECYKTYDDVNLVKTGDIGQVLVVGGITQEEAQCGITRDGVTPPMRNAKQRVFRQPIPVPPATVQRVETELLKVLHGGAPAGYRYVDYEEVWQIDETGKGSWVPVKP